MKKSPKYTKQFKEVMEFWKNTTPAQHKMFLEMISDSLLFFDGEETFICNPEDPISLNGTFYQINIETGTFY